MESMASTYKAQASHAAITTQFLVANFYAGDATGMSDMWNIAGSSLVDIFMPSTWVAANLWVYACLPSIGAGIGSIANYVPLYREDGSPYIIIIPVTTGCVVQVNPYDFVGLDAVAFQSVSTGSSSTPVTQTAGPAITLVSIGNGSF